MAKTKTKKTTRTTTPRRPVVATASVETDIDGATSMAQEYDYVRKDLRHLAVISVVLFVVMLGVGFFI